MKKFIFLVCVLSSCAPVYVPNIRNSPMFQKGGEFQAAVQVGNGIDGQVAVSFTDHFGLIANYNYINRDKGTNDSLRHNLLEAGLGYFTNKEDMFFEIFAGYGKGEGFSTGTIFDLQNVTGKYERYFIQPALGMNHKYIHVSFVPRISIVDFKEYSIGSVSYVVNEDPKVFFEPCVVMKVNTDNNRFFYTLQGGVSVSVSNDLYFDHRKYQVATGFGVRLGGVRPAKESRQ
jgi:hypothetical protein